MDDLIEMTMDGSVVIAPCRRVEGSLRVPGDKSISHRTLLVSAIAEGDSTIDGLSPAEDVHATLRMIRALGVRAEGHSNGDNSQLDPESSSSSSRDSQILVRGGGLGSLRTSIGPIDVGNSGTSIRLGLGVLAGSQAEATLTGDASIRRRPMGRVVEPLRRMGADIQGQDGGELAPLMVRGKPLTGVHHDIPVASAQVKSALLLAGLAATGVTSVSEPAQSRDHTERLLRYLGVQIDGSPERLSVKSINIQGASMTVPGDFSSAAFFLAAAAIDGQVRIDGVGVNPTRTGFLDAVEAFGGRVESTSIREVCGEPVGSVSVRAGDRRPLTLAGGATVAALDELPLVAVLGCFAEGETEVRDAAELRVKEADRIEAMVTGLSAMGADIRALPDGFVITGPARLRGATVDPAGDHRIAMALAVAALFAEGPTTITGWGCVGVSYPGFERALAAVAVP